MKTVLFTHAHSDHYLGVDDLKPFCYIQKLLRCPCYSDEVTANRIKSIFDYVFFKDPNWKGGKLPELDLKLCKPGDKLEILGKTVEVFFFTTWKDAYTRI